MPQNRSMPDGIVIPELPYPNVRVAADWLCQAFGFTERLRIGTHRAQLALDGGSIIITQLAAGVNAAAAGSPQVSMMVRVADVQQHYERTSQFGAKLINPPVDYPYGERQVSVEDIAGYRWTFSQTIADVDPAEWGGVPGRDR